jgi:hypothetical protein
MHYIKTCVTYEVTTRCRITFENFTAIFIYGHEILCYCGPEVSLPSSQKNDIKSPKSVEYNLQVHNIFLYAAF